MNLIVDDLDVVVKDEGSGPVVLMLHGWKSDLSTFDQLAEVLKKTHRVIRPNLPGFGGSQMPPSDWTVEDYAKFVTSYLKKMKATEVECVIGHSMGGRIAIKGLGNGIFDSKKLILVGAAGVPQSKTAKSMVFLAIAKVGGFFAKVLPGSIQEKLKRRLYAAAGTTDYLASGELKEIFSNMINEDARKYASSVTSKTLLIYGAEDREAPPSFGEAFAHLIPNSKLEVIPGAGHYVHTDQASLIERKVIEFLK